MVRSWLLVIVSCSAAVLALSCGHGQILESITVTPATETFGASNIPVIDETGLNVQLRAIGNYLYLPGTKDITNQVTWVSNTPQMITVSKTGVITATGLACGNTLVSATMPVSGSGANAVVTGSMTANVVCPSTP